MLPHCHPQADVLKLVRVITSPRVPRESVLADTVLIRMLPTFFGKIRLDGQCRIKFRRFTDSLLTTQGERLSAKLKVVNMRHFEREATAIGRHIYPLDCLST